MTATTTTGTGTVVGLMSTACSNVTLPANTATSLLQSGPVTITGSGHTVVFSGSSDPGPAASMSVAIVVDGVTQWSGSAGNDISFKMVLSAGSHTLDFQATADGYAQVMQDANLTAMDLGV